MSPEPTPLDRIASRPRRHRHFEPRRAVGALRRLLADPSQTQNAMEVAYALDGDTAPRELARLARHPEGRRLLESRPRLLERLSDDATLAALPEGSLGRAYRDHLTRHGLEVGKLVQLRAETDPWRASHDALERWIEQRELLQHDLEHVLAGYGADSAGEAALLAFSCGQDARLGRLLLTAGASFEMCRQLGLRWLAVAWRAWRRGRRAVDLVALPYEELLALPLADVRRAAGIEPPERAHATGVCRWPEELPAGA